MSHNELTSVILCVPEKLSGFSAQKVASLESFFWFFRNNKKHTLGSDSALAGLQKEMEENLCLRGTKLNKEGRNMMKCVENLKANINRT